MRIGIDGTCLANKRGFGRFARQTLRALAEAESAHEFVVFVDRPSASEVAIPDRFRRVVVDLREAPSRAASADGRRRVGDMLAMGKAVAREGLDLFFFPASYSAFPIWGVRRVVVTMHDTLALAHPELVFPRWQGRVAWTIKEHFSARRADCIVTVSESARRDLIAWFHLAPDRVRVVTEGPDSAFRPIPPGPGSDEVLSRNGIEPGSRFLLYVGGLSPHKNLPRLIEAFSRLGDDATKLVLVGDLADVFHTHVPELRRQIENLGLSEKIRFTGFVPDDDLAHLYNRAYLLVQPSIMEGFGLPPVEAMACGTPVAYSRAGSLPEVIGDSGVDFDPLDVEGMASTLKGLLEAPDHRDLLAKRALERSRRFTWTASARSLVDCFDALDPTRARGLSA